MVTYFLELAYLGRKWYTNLAMIPDSTPRLSSNRSRFHRFAVGNDCRAQESHTKSISISTGKTPKPGARQTFFFSTLHRRHGGRSFNGIDTPLAWCNDDVELEGLAGGECSLVKEIELERLPTPSTCDRKFGIGAKFRVAGAGPVEGF